VIIQLGRDGLKKPTKKKKTKTPAPAPAPQVQQSFMSPIYIPAQPVPIIRQRIRNQADIQEELRAYDRAQQDSVGPNAAAFEQTNIRKGVLYPMKLKRDDDPAFFDAPEPMSAEEEEKTGAKRPRVAQEVGRETAQRMFGPEAVAPEPAPAAEARFAFGSPVPAKVMGAIGGRPKGSGNKKKTKDELKAEIAATGSVPDNFKDMKLPEVVILARERGISLMR